MHYFPCFFDGISLASGACWALTSDVSWAPDTILTLLEGQASSLSSETGFDARVREWLDASSGPWQYLLLFVLAAIPLFEILLVIPIGVALGLDPLLVAVVAFAGNALPIYGIVLGYERLSAWLEGRRDSASDHSNRRARARRIWNAYGMPGLALLAPIVTGIHLATILALGFGARGRSTLLWMTASIGVWTVVITVASVTGMSMLEGVIG